VRPPDQRACILTNPAANERFKSRPIHLVAQQKWLEQQLRDAKAAKARQILLFQHHPLFLTKENEPDQYFNIPLVRRTPLLEQLKQTDGRAVFAGHYHRNAYGRAGAMEMITTGPVGRHPAAEAG
jgi:UDP-2,3-diacylglucosamine pyrophosphatase LpxH